MSLLDHLDNLRNCPPGRPGWRQFEEICTDILTDLFVPPLPEPLIQSRTLSGTDIRDTIFHNNSWGKGNNWDFFLQKLDATSIVFEFKNYNSEDIGQDEVNQLRDYLKGPMGKLGILCCNKEPVESAYIKRNTAYCEERKVILFLLPEDLEEMIYTKENGDDPSNTMLDLYLAFCDQYE